MFDAKYKNEVSKVRLDSNEEALMDSYALLYRNMPEGAKRWLNATFKENKDKRDAAKVAAAQAASSK